jgi:hypothetical protein
MSGAVRHVRSFTFCFVGQYDVILLYTYRSPQSCVFMCCYQICFRYQGQDRPKIKSQLHLVRRKCTLILNLIWILSLYCSLQQVTSYAERKTHNAGENIHKGTRIRLDVCIQWRNLQRYKKKIEF